MGCCCPARVGSRLVAWLLDRASVSAWLARRRWNSARACHARDLFIAAMVDRSSSYPPSNIGSLVSKSHGIALIMLNSRISCIHSSGVGPRPSVERSEHHQGLGGRFNRPAISCSRLSKNDFCGAGLASVRAAPAGLEGSAGVAARASSVAGAAGSLGVFGAVATARMSSVSSGRRTAVSSRGEGGGGVDASVSAAAGSPAALGAAVALARTNCRGRTLRPQRRLGSQ
jgi:hypothetical protein